MGDPFDTGSLCLANGCRIIIARAFAVLIAVAASTVVGILPGTLAAEPVIELDCDTQPCELFKNGAYRELLLGRVIALGTDADMQRFRDWARAHKYWHAFPVEIDPYVRTAVIVFLSVEGSSYPHGIPIIVTRRQVAASSLKPGDLIRYAPNQSKVRKDRGGEAENQIYYELAGYFAYLCQSEYPHCFANYIEGFFDLATGRRLDPVAGTPVADGEGIDPKTLLPIAAKSATGQTASAAQ